jgi:hypothetical protein
MNKGKTITSICLIASLFILSGCKDKFQEGYQSGYIDGAYDTELKLKKEYEIKISELERKNQNSFSVTSTEVCGGSGVNLNGKHYSGGKTGCVRVYSNGRVERY